MGAENAVSTAGPCPHHTCWALGIRRLRAPALLLPPALSETPPHPGPHFLRPQGNHLESCAGGS